MVLLLLLMLLLLLLLAETAAAAAVVVADCDTDGSTGDARLSAAPLPPSSPIMSAKASSMFPPVRCKA